LSIGRMMVTKENRSTWRKTCSDGVLSTINLSRAVLGSNLGLPGDRQGTNNLDDGTAQKRKFL
jgi:hypothetical protein